MVLPPMFMVLPPRQKGMAPPCERRRSVSRCLLVPRPEPIRHVPIAATVRRTLEDPKVYNAVLVYECVVQIGVGRYRRVAVAEKLSRVSPHRSLGLGPRRVNGEIVNPAVELDEENVVCRHSDSPGGKAWKRVVTSARQTTQAQAGRLRVLP